MEIILACLMLIIAALLFMGTVILGVNIITSIFDFIAVYALAGQNTLSVIEFNEFLRYYEVNPDRWELDTAYISYHCWNVNNRGYGFSRTYIFRFGFIDYIKYRIWLFQINRQKKKEAALTQKQKLQDDYGAFLNEIQNDIRRKMEERNER
jgi:hypothetical protein